MLREKIINLLIRLIIRYPKLMNSILLKKIIVTGHSKAADKFEAIINEQPDYEAPLEEGLRYIKDNHPAPGKVIDLATGTGFAAFKAEEILAPREIAGIDLSAQMLKLAREKAEAKGQENISFKKQDAADLDYGASQFDLAVVSNAPFYLAEISRILRPDGHFLLSLAFGGKVIANNKQRIKEYFSQYDFQVEKISQVERGGLIISQLQRD